MLLVAAAVLAGQVSIGWRGDALDAGRDAAAGRPDKPVDTGAVPVAGHRAGRPFPAVLVVAAIALLVLFAASGQWAGAVRGAVA
ncbi:hypothetical protein [Pseudonocardia sp. DLS-67]